MVHLRRYPCIGIGARRKRSCSFCSHVSSDRGKVAGARDASARRLRQVLAGVSPRPRPPGGGGGSRHGDAGGGRQRHHGHGSASVPRGAAGPNSGSPSRVRPGPEGCVSGCAAVESRLRGPWAFTLWHTSRVSFEIFQMVQSSLRCGGVCAEVHVAFAAGHDM